MGVVLKPRAGSKLARSARLREPPRTTIKPTPSPAGATQNDESGQRLVAAAVIVQCVAQGFKLRSFLSCNCSGVALQGHFTFIAFAKHEHFLVIMRAKSFNKQAATSRDRTLPPLKRGRPEALKRGRK